MDIQELKSNILQNKLKHSYIFIGDELALQDIYINKIAEVTGFEKIRIDSLKQIYSKLRVKSIIKAKPKIYIIRNDDQYIKTPKLWTSIVNGKVCKDNIIIMLYSGIDKRSKFCNEHEPILVDFQFIGESLLRNREQAITKWPIQYCQEFVRICGCNYGRIQNELYKLQILAKVNNYSLETAYLQAVKNNFLHEEIGDIIFDFTNAVVERDIVKSYQLLRKIEKTTEGPIKLLTVLYNGFRNVLIVQSTQQKERTEEILGLTRAQIYVSSLKCDRYSLYELVHILKLIQKIEKGIKTGEVSDKYAMEYLLGEIF